MGRLPDQRGIVAIERGFAPVRGLGAEKFRLGNYAGIDFPLDGAVARIAIPAANLRLAEIDIGHGTPVAAPGCYPGARCYVLACRLLQYLGADCGPCLGPKSFFPAIHVRYPLLPQSTGEAGR